jgi:NTE family protein
MYIRQVPFVLSGGGSRGFAHVGVLHACAEHHITPSAISGTSSGALVGAFIASGWTTAQLSELMMTSFASIPSAWGQIKNIITLTNLGAFLEKHLTARNFSDLSIPLYVSATNYHNGKQHVFTSGPLIPVLLAACAIPIVTKPVEIHGIPYVDGGLSDNLPIQPFQSRIQTTICVDVNPPTIYTPDSHPINQLDRVAHLILRRFASHPTQEALLYLNPSDLTSYGIFDTRLPQIYAAGYAYTQEILKEHAIHRRPRSRLLQLLHRAWSA